VLHLGNVGFEGEERATARGDSLASLQTAADLLALNLQELGACGLGLSRDDFLLRP
jgi:hypothetical protein